MPFARQALHAGRLGWQGPDGQKHSLEAPPPPDLEKLIECAHMAEEIVGHPLPGKVMRGGSLARYRQLAGAQ